MQRFHAPLIRTAVAAILLAGGATMPALAAVCDNVTFSFTNISGGPLKITKVGYRDLDSSNPSKRQVERLYNAICPTGATCNMVPEDLGSIATPRENHELTDIQFFHSHEDAYGFWMPAVWSNKNVPTTMTCTDNRTYGPYDLN